MGGQGSGSHYHWWRNEKKTTVEECLSIDANRWTREGILKAGVNQAGVWSWTNRNSGALYLNYEVQTFDMVNPLVRFSYSWTWNGEGAPADYYVQLTTTQPQFGGLRWWFLCPILVNGEPCGRRVGKLYLPPRARSFGCRQCHDLTYESCQDSHKNDALTRIIARNLGAEFRDVHRSLQRVIKGKL